MRENKDSAVPRRGGQPCRRCIGMHSGRVCARSQKYLCRVEGMGLRFGAWGLGFGVLGFMV